MRSPLSPEVLSAELSLAIEILKKWKDQIGSWPAIDIPGSEEQYYEYIKTMAAELFLVAKKTDSVASILLSDGP